MAYGDGRGARGVEFGPAPEGFDVSPPDIGGRDPALLSERGCCFWLSDTRLDLTGPQRVWTSRLAQQVTGGDGLQPAASFEIVFNPAFERPVIHTVRVWRDGTAREAASPEAFELFRRELNLERAAYDGRLTAHMIVPDVRVGDVVDTIYSIVGSNPLLGDALCFTPRLQWAAPVVETRVEVRAPAGRDIVVQSFGRAPAPADETRDGVRALRWRAVDMPPWRHDPDSPPWHIGHAALHVADRRTWAEVADLFRDFYAPPECLPETLETAAAGIVAAEATPAGRTTAALRLVQGALRYHSIGVGDGGYRPRPVEAIWATRYGDCKDSSRLLTALLRRLGIEATPALVHTRLGPALDREPPTPLAFDHCIVRVVVDGETWWLDPTLTPQAGDLRHLTPPRHVWALPLAPGAGLERMREPPRPTVCETEETWSFDARADRPARLELRSVYRDWRADDMRRWLDNDGRRNVARRLRESLEAEYGQAVEAAPLEVRDAPAENRLELVELYDVDRPLQPRGPDAVEFLSRDDVVGPNLRDLETARRLEPIDLGTPRRLVTRRVFNLPYAPDFGPWRVEHAGPGFDLKSELEWTGPRQATHVLELTLNRRILDVDEAQRHFAAVREARRLNGVSFTAGVRRGRLVRSRPPRHGVTWAGWIVVAILGLSALANLAASVSG